jgi:uncharacterized protein (TIGR03437 family)
MDAPGIVAADSLPLSPSLSGVSVTLNGAPVPILAVANTAGTEQVNFQAPFEIAGQSKVSMRVVRDGSSSSAVDIPVLPIQPGVFTSDLVHGLIILLPDYKLMTPDQPLERGKYAYFYAEGLGSVSNQPASGAGAPGFPFALVQSDIRLTVGGVPCPVLFAGLSPALVGVYQVNFQVAPDAPTGPQDLVVIVGGVAGPAVKVFVR